MAAICSKYNGGEQHAVGINKADRAKSSRNEKGEASVAEVTEPTEF